jgi:pimeloyl-ACP methyl ester carboxylesterase
MSSPHRTRFGAIAVELYEPATTPPGTILLLHGIGGSAATFAGVAPHLAAAGWRAVAWDAPGYGASADPGPEVTAPGSPDAYVATVAQLVQALGTDSVHLVGVSWGGVIATHVAARRPELVASLALVDSTRGSGINAEKAAAMRGRVAELHEMGGRAFAAQRAHRLLADGAAPTIAAEVERQMSQVRLAGYAGAAEMMAQSDTGPLLSGLVVPTLVLVGEQDRVTGVAESRLLAGEIPGALFGLIGDAGHAAVQERPAEVAGALLSFLAAQAPHSQISQR